MSGIIERMNSTKFGAVWSAEGSPIAQTPAPAPIEPTPPVDAPADPSLIGKPPAPEPTATVEPLTAESIKIPEGMVVDDASRDEFLKVMNNAELGPKDRAQALIDLQAKTMQAVSERGNKLWTDMQDKWVEQANTEFGAGLQPMLGNISKLLDQYGGTAEQVKELRDVFTLTGAGNHPAIVRFLDNLGKPLREGTARGGNPSGGQRSPGEVLYPSMPKGDI